MYRLTPRARERRDFCGRDANAPSRIDRWEPPELRRVIEITDYDTGQPITHRIELLRSDRIDCYRVIADGRPWRRRAGWAQVLAGVRKALPRVAGAHR
jgi:hypothetical protein